MSEMNRNYIWIVSYIATDYVNGRWIDNVVVTPFENEEAATKMYEYYEGKIDYIDVCIGNYEVFNGFFTPKEVENMSREEVEKLKLREE